MTVAVVFVLVISVPLVEYKVSSELVYSTFGGLKNFTRISTVNSGFINRTIRINWYRNLKWLPNKFDFQMCEFKNCKLALLKHVSYKSSDALIFHYRLLKGDPPRKPKGQIWILWNSESPASDEPLPKLWNNVFDWTITYRKESEITNRRVIVLRNEIFQKNYTDIFKRKTKFAAWVVSNCKTQSRREVYVKELQKYIDVDIFGACSPKKNTCKHLSSAACQTLLSKEYKFYLGFESSICKDYVTEKLQLSFLKDNNMINVYRGAPNVDSTIPRSTFINTKNYKSPEALAKYLMHLASNESEYVSVLKEKDKYLLQNNKTEQSLCSLCKMLNYVDRNNVNKTGRHFNEWYRHGACSQPLDLQL